MAVGNIGNVAALRCLASEPPKHIAVHGVVAPASTAWIGKDASE